MASIPPISLRLPSKYAAAADPAAGPPEDWLCSGSGSGNGTDDDDDATTWWTVTHSTLALWRSAQNVRIRYRARPPRAGRPSNEDRVAYEKLGSTSDGGRGGGVHTVEGVNVADAPTSTPAAWDWRGKSWLFFVTSHWEILGWGEAPVADGNGNDTTTTERWAVTWFASTLFTKEGIDIYCDRPGGLSPPTMAALLRALGAAEAPATPAWPAPLAALVAQLQPVAIRLPWQKA